jgi:2-methylfumaryl-CoA isomerase
MAKHTLAEVSEVFERLGVCWGPYQTFMQLVEEDWRCSVANPMFKDVEQPGIGKLRVPGSPASFDASPRLEPVPAPRLGEHTDQILAIELGLSTAEIRKLHDDGVVAGPSNA